jgi:hypothetical protein
MGRREARPALRPRRGGRRGRRLRVPAGHGLRSGVWGGSGLHSLRILRGEDRLRRHELLPELTLPGAACLAQAHGGALLPDGGRPAAAAVVRPAALSLEPTLSRPDVVPGVPGSAATIGRHPADAAPARRCWGQRDQADKTTGARVRQPSAHGGVAPFGGHSIIGQLMPMRRCSHAPQQAGVPPGIQS